MKIDTNSIAHTTLNCKYHIVFARKYRRQVIYEKIKGDIGQIIPCHYRAVQATGFAGGYDSLFILYFSLVKAISNGEQ